MNNPQDPRLTSGAFRIFRRLASVRSLLIAVALCMAGQATAAAPDLTAGGVPTESDQWNLGPTGMTGWCYRDGQASTNARQFLVRSVAGGSPATGIMAVNDVIPGGNNIGGAAPATLNLPANWAATVSISGNSLLLNITSTGQSPYQTWAGGAAFDADANNNGVENGIAFLLGAASPTSAVTRPSVTQTGSGLVLNFNMLKPTNRGTATLNVQHSHDIGIADPWTTVPVPNESGGPTAGVTFIVTPGGGTTDAVQATISSSEASGSGKLFGCLKALTP